MNSCLPVRVFFLIFFVGNFLLRLHGEITFIWKINVFCK